MEPLVYLIPPYQTTNASVQLDGKVSCAQNMIFALETHADKMENVNHCLTTTVVSVTLGSQVQTARSMWMNAECKDDHAITEGGVLIHSDLINVTAIKDTTEKTVNGFINHAVLHPAKTEAHAPKSVPIVFHAHVPQVLLETNARSI